MDAEILQGFVEQAESSLPKIRGGILVCAREGNTYGALDSAIHELGSIGNAASVMGFEEVEKSAAQLAEKLKPFAAAKEKLPEAIKEFDIGNVVREKINNYPVEKLESLVLSIAKEHLRTIELFGALFGLLIGIVQAALSYWAFAKH